jgi:hypothetical protein
MYTWCNENNAADKCSYDVIFSLNFFLSEISMNNVYIIHNNINKFCTLVWFRIYIFVICLQYILYAIFTIVSW